MTKTILIKGKYRPVMVDGEGKEGSYTPQNALLLNTEEKPGVMKMFIRYIDKKRDEARNNEII